MVTEEEWPETERLMVQKKVRPQTEDFISLKHRQQKSGDDPNYGWGASTTSDYNASRATASVITLPPKP